MALAYGTRLTVEPGHDPSRQLEVVADIVGAWARIPDPLSDSQRSGRRDGTEATWGVRPCAAVTTIGARTGTAGPESVGASDIVGECVQPLPDHHTDVIHLARW